MKSFSTSSVIGAGAFILLGIAAAGSAAAQVVLPNMVHDGKSSTIGMLPHTIYDNVLPTELPPGPPPNPILDDPGLDGDDWAGGASLGGFDTLTDPLGGLGGGITPVPEPATIGLLIVGGLALARRGVRR